MIRSLVTKLTGLIAERSHSPRKKYAAPVKLWFERESGRLIHTSTADGLFMSGETIDLSKTGIGIMVSGIRMKEHYIVGQNRVLNVEIDLPREIERRSRLLDSRAGLLQRRPRGGDTGFSALELAFE